MSQAIVQLDSRRFSASGLLSLFVGDAVSRFACKSLVPSESRPLAPCLWVALGADEQAVRDLEPLLVMAMASTGFLFQPTDRMSERSE